MPHTHPAYCEDNIAVWEIIRDSIHATEAFSWVKRCKRRHDGRAAYLALAAHYLGNAKNEALRNAACNKILNTFDGGERITSAGLAMSLYIRSAITTLRQQVRQCLRTTRCADS